MNVLLFGPPGAGKGTQAEAVVARLGVPHVATGDIFRRHLKEQTELGRLAKGFMDRGELVPDEVVCALVTDRLSQEDASGGVLLDGFPRTVAQGRILLDWLASNGRAVDLVLSLEVSPELLVARLSGRRTCRSCGRSYHAETGPPRVNGVCDACGGEVVQRDDDREDTVRSRLETYLRETAAVLPFLAQNCRVVRIDGSQSIGEVGAMVSTAIDQAQSSP